ncbi:hypothetical protein Acr_00g0056320 [Actinidia rufa]|uniref:Uncharacterized protein n=1 Tax=Actinidia rufa TaxID=165716 RepID=A0A7J0DNQ2_9ERIC|nr:hypothetical protein Acr_00g0056320 [Actinidia rufa]
MEGPSRRRRRGGAEKLRQYLNFNLYCQALEPRVSRSLAREEGHHRAQVEALDLMVMQAFKEQCPTWKNTPLSSKKAGDFSMRQVVKLRSGSFQEGSLASLKEFSTLAEHPTWIAIAPKVAILNSPEVYLPMILQSFNKEEYMNQLIEEGNQGVAEVGNANGEDELGAGAKEGGVGDGNQDNLSKCNVFYCLKGMILKESFENTVCKCFCF